MGGVFMKQNLSTDFKPVLLAMFTKDKMLYSEYQPCKELSQFINCYWVSPTILSLGDFIYSAKQEIIIPDGCMDIIFEVDKQTNDYNCYIVGMMSKPIIAFPDFSQKQIYAIRFNPGGAYSFINNNLDDFTDLAVDLKNISNNLEREMAAIFLSKKSLYEKIKYLNVFFLRHFSQRGQNEVIMNSLASIFSAKGNVEINKLAQDLHISERQLNRIFKQRIGLAPKEFTRIIRFQNALQRVLLSSNVNWSSLAVESGYHDQAHFIGEFKTFAGITPTQAIK